MSDVAARRVWLVCSGILFVLTFNYFSISQSWGMSLGLGFLTFDISESNAVLASVAGIPVVAIGLILTSYIGLRHIKAKQKERCTWDELVPIKISGLESRSQESRVLASISLLFFTVLPLFALWHLLRKFFKYGVVCDTKSNSILELGARVRGLPTWDNRYLIGNSSDACNGATFEPFWQPFMYIYIVLAATLLISMFFYRIIVTSRDA